MRHYLIASDLDRTLLDANHRLSSLTRRTLQTLAGQGHVIVLASGRHYRDVAAIREKLEIPAWIVSSNGAYVHDPEDRVVVERLLPSAEIRALVELPRPDDVRLNFYTRERWLIDAEAPALLPLHAETGFVYEVSELHDAVDEPVGKVLYIGAPDQLAPLERELRERFSQALHVTYSAENSLEIMRQGVNKATALEAVIAATQTPLSRSLAFGDNFNDIEMLESVGQGFVVGNAHPEVIRRLPKATRIGHHDREGVAEALREFFSLS